jgi:hypothetical protein
MLVPVSLVRCFIIVLAVVPVHGILVIQRGVNGTEEVIPVHVKAMLLWRDQVDVSNVTLVSLNRDKKLFDYCDLQSYSKEGVEGLLAAHNVTSKTWVATLTLNLASTCQLQTYHEIFVFNYPHVFSAYIEKTGALGERRHRLLKFPIRVARFLNTKHPPHTHISYYMQA